MLQGNPAIAERAKGGGGTQKGGGSSKNATPFPTEIIFAASPATGGAGYPLITRGT